MRDIEYLLKYISNDCYSRILNKTNEYILDSLVYSRVDVDLNIRYLIKHGVKNIDDVVYGRLEDLIMEHNEFIDKMNKYEHTLGYEGFISMIENV